MRRKSSILELPLFEAEAPAEVVSVPVAEAVSKLKWSYSKRGVLEQCPRRFYYQYYGANQGKAKDDPSKQELHQLKLAGNRYTRTGAILHLVIADYFRKAQQGTPWEHQQWLNWARTIFERDIARSCQGLEETKPSYRKHPPQFLIEFLHEKEARQLCREALAEMMAALNAFLDDPEFAGMRNLGIQPGALIEKHFHNLGGFPFGVEGQVDLVCPAETGTVIVVDWKIGDDLGDGDDSLQLAVYALWAKETFSCAAEDITLYKGFLGSSTLVEFPISERLLKTARLKMLQDAEWFERMHGYGCAGVVEAFTPCAQGAVCRGCSFVTLCPEGKESLTW